MYLISVYFDQQTDQKIQRYIKKVSEYSGNTFMLEHQVPAHMTVLSFQTNNEEEAIKILEKCQDHIQRDDLFFVSFGVFLPYVIYITPVLNEYLLNMSTYLYESLSLIEDISFVSCYTPLNWMPHTTIAKKLSQEEMKKAFEVLQKEFHPFHATITRIALSKTNPYKDIISFDLKENKDEK